MLDRDDRDDRDVFQGSLGSMIGVSRRCNICRNWPDTGDSGDRDVFQGSLGPAKQKNKIWGPKGDGWERSEPKF